LEIKIKHVTYRLLHGWKALFAHDFLASFPWHDTKPDLVAKWLHNIVFEQARRNQKETIKGFSVLPVHLSMLLKWKKKKLPHFNLNLCINVFLDNYLTR
jgi:hypothetical protein